MALIDKETIRAEIERRLIGYDPDYTSAGKELDELIKFLDTLPEQPVVKKSNALFEECLANVDPAIRKEVSDNIDKMLGRQLVEGVEEAAEKYNEMMSWRWEAPNYPHKAAFIAGAEYQRKQDQQLIELAEDHAILAGMNKMKEEMMEKAVEGIARPDDCEIWVNLVGYGYKFKDGDKVRVIVIKED